MATQFSHNSFLYFKYIIRKGNGTFVSSANLKLQSFFILIPGSPKLPGPPKTFSFILYTYHSQNQRAKRTAKPFRPLIFLFFPFLFSAPAPETTTTFCASSGQPQTCCRQDEQSCKKPSLPYISHLRKTHPPVSVRTQIQPARAVRRRRLIPGKNFSNAEHRLNFRLRGFGIFVSGITGCFFWFLRFRRLWFWRIRLRFLRFGSIRAGRFRLRGFSVCHGNLILRLPVPRI